MDTIAFVANTSWSIYNFRLGIIKTLLHSNYNIVVIAPYDEYSEKLETLGCQYISIEMDNYGTNPFTDLKTIISLISIYMNIRPNLIFHYTIKPNIYGTIAGYICGIPSIAVTTGLGHLFFRRTITKLVTSSMYRLAGRLCKEMWFLNKVDIKDFKKQGIVSTKKIKLLNSEGVNTEHFMPIKQKQKSNDKIIFLFAGRLIKDKGLEILIEAAKQIKNSKVQFNVLGFIDTNNPNSIDKVDIQRNNKDGYIHYLGETTDVRPFIAEADCIIFPSFYREGISRILLESASMGKPIITTNNVGCREVVENGVNGFLIEPKSLESLKKTIQKFIELDSSEKKEMGEKGRLKVLKEFDERLIIDHYLETIDRFCKINMEVYD